MGDEELENTSGATEPDLEVNDTPKPKAKAKAKKSAGNTARPGHRGSGK